MTSTMHYSYNYYPDTYLWCPPSHPAGLKDKNACQSTATNMHVAEVTHIYPTTLPPHLLSYPSPPCPLPSYPLTHNIHYFSPVLYSWCPPQFPAGPDGGNAWQSTSTNLQVGC